MSPRSTPMRLTLVAGVVACSLFACSKDAPTALSDQPASGEPRANVFTLAAPANDDFDNATVITALPFTDHVNTAEATTATDDPLGDDSCGFDSIDGHTVWYQFTPTQNMRINANTGGDFDHNIFIYTGTRGNLTRVTCNFVPHSATLNAQAGVTYYLLLGSNGDDPGGDVVFTVQLSLEVTMTIDHVGELDVSTGVVPVRGTTTCSRPAFVEGGIVWVEKAGSEDAARGGHAVRGFVDLPFAYANCDGVIPWEVDVAFEGQLPLGRAKVRAGGLFIYNSSSEEIPASDSTSVVLKP